MRLAVITSGFLPVPATMGGAVENLIVNLLDENEKERKIEFHIFSIYDEDAVRIANSYINTKFEFIRINSLVKFVDKIIFFIADKIIKLEHSHKFKYIFQRLSFLNKVSLKLKNNNYDKVLLENHPTQYLALKWRKNYLKYKDNYYYHCHNEFPSAFACSEIIKNTKKIICVSQFIANSIQKFMDMPENKFIILRNCIDVCRFEKKLSLDEQKKIMEKYNIKDNDKILLFTGRITQEKGVKELVEALLKLKYENYKLLILGASLFGLNFKTKYQEEIECLIKSIPDKVIFTGFVDYSEIYKFYSIADIAVLPSTWNDPAPLTIIESLISGLPIITTNSGGIPEYATNGSAIILDRNNNLVNNIAESIDDLLNNEQKRKKMKEIGKDVSNDLTLENFYKNFILTIR